MKLKEPFSVYSNIVFLVPFLIALAEGFFLYAVLIFLVFICSTVFHATKIEGPLWWSKSVRLKGKQSFYFWSDIVSASLLAIYTFFIFWKNNFPKEFFYSIPFIFIAFYFFFVPKRFKYDTTQDIWHIMAGIITILAVIS